MLKKFLLFIAALIAAINALSQPQRPDTLWTKTIGGPSDDLIRCAKELGDNGFIFAGYTNSIGAGGFDCYLIKTDTLGNCIWERTYGGAGGDMASDLQITSQGNFVCAGKSSPFGMGDQMYLFKTDSSGNLLWQRSFGGAADDFCASLVCANDGGFILAGSTYSFGNGGADFLILKTDSLGNMEWSRTFGESGDEFANRICASNDGNFVIVGKKFAPLSRNADIYLLKIDPLGNEIWSTVFGGSDNDNGKAVIQTEDDGYAIAGCTYDNVNCSIFVYKTDPLGNPIWHRIYDTGTAGCASDIVQTVSAGFIVTGFNIQDGNEDADLYIMKINADGYHQWGVSLGGGSEDEGNSVVKIEGGRYLIAGKITCNGSKDGYIAKMDKEGTILDLVTYQNTITIPPAGGEIYFRVDAENNDPSPITYDFWTKMTSPEGNIYEIIRYEGLTLDASSAVTRYKSQFIPNSAPEGLYLYQAFFGEYPVSEAFSDTFSFVKSGTETDSVSGYDFQPEIDSQPTIFPTQKTAGVTVLFPPYPNPFNSTANITFEIPVSAEAIVSVFDINGKQLKTLSQGYFSQGVHQIVFDGSELPTGVYFIKLETDRQVSVQKILLVK